MKNYHSLIKWSSSEFDSLPWRFDRTLYRTIVSEFMLQQTTVQTVLKHFEAFFHTFPNLKSLAEADEELVLKSWSGLGYYRRARNLHRLAKELQANHNGKIPKDISVLKKLSGVGIYTAMAISSIGHNEKALAIDANIERVLCRIYGLDLDSGPKAQKYLYKLFDDGDLDDLFYEHQPRAINEALMDLGRTYCKANVTNCSECPIKSDCHAYQINKPLAFPRIQKKKAKKSYQLTLLRLVMAKEGSYLCYKKNENEWLTNQYEIPTFIINSNDSAFVQYPHWNDFLSKLRPNNMEKVEYEKLVKNSATINTSITYYKIENKILNLNKMKNLHKKIVMKLLKDYEFMPFKKSKTHFSTASIKCIDKMKTV